MLNFNINGLEGRAFHLGVTDCFTLVRDFYKKNFDIDMPDFSRPNDWKPEEDNMIDNLYEVAGFEKLDVDLNWPPRPADLLVCTVGGAVPNHLVVVLGGNEIIHHKVGMFSAKETMRPAWRRYTSYILRHPQVPDLTEKKPSMTLKEVYDAKLV
jgi:cell wall-associated NlpC family hydrolase